MNRAAEMRARIVARMEAENAACGYAEYWRMNGDRAQVGSECGRSMRWVDVPFLSARLLTEYRAQREAKEQGIPF